MTASRIQLSDPAAVFQVKAGSADVFLAIPGGALFYVLRAVAGEYLLGMSIPHPNESEAGNKDSDAESTKRRIEMVVVPGPDAQLESVSEVPPTALDIWCERVSAAAAPSEMPRSAISIAPGMPVAPAESVTTVSTGEVLVWVRMAEGNAFLFGDEKVMLSPADAPFPLTRSSWIDLAPNAQVEIDATQSEALPATERLQRFRHVMAEALVARLEASRLAERERLTKRTTADSRRLDVAFRNIATPLRDGEAPQPFDAHAAADPLFGAITAVGDALGLKIVAPPTEPHRRVVVSAADATREKVAAIARSSGISHRQVTLTDGWWDGDAGPFLAFQESDGAAVAVLATGPGKYVLVDPATRVRRRVKPAVANTLSPTAYVFYRPFPLKSLTAGDLLKFGFRGCRQDAWIVLSAGIAAGALGMMTPTFTRVLYDTIIPESRATDLYQLAAFLTASTISGIIFTLARGYAVLRVENRMNSSIQAAVWDRLLGLPTPFFRRFSSGDLSMRSMGIDRIRAAITSSALGALLSGIFSIFNFALLFWFSWRLALVAAGLTAFSLLILALTSYREIKLKRELSAQEGKLNGLTLEILRGISKFRVAGAESRGFANWAREFTGHQGLTARSRSLSIRFAAFQAGYPTLCSIFLFFTMSLADKGSISTGQYLAFSVSFSQFLSATLQLATGIVAVAGVLPLYERALPILEALPETAGARRDPGPLSGRIEISHIAFRYKPGAPQVLRDVSTRIEPGQFVAFVGGSGCGKSTLFRLLLGFEEPEAGRIYFDGQDLAGLDYPAVRRQMGVVLQNARLSAGSILNNILGSAALTINDAWAAAAMAGLDDDIKALPMGMYTMISDGGGTLSGGQRQRILIARALVRKPRMLLFDEATSALDNRTQAIVSESLERLRCTRVVIAHRLSTIRKADLICYLDKGAIAESGNYDELMAKNGLFAQLARRQLV